MLIQTLSCESRLLPNEAQYSIAILSNQPSDCMEKYAKSSTYMIITLIRMHYCLGCYLGYYVDCR